MAPLPLKPSWVHATEGPEVPQCWCSAAPPWRPAGRKSLTQSQVFLSQASRPSSAPSTAPTLGPSDTPSRRMRRPRPHSAPRPRSPPLVPSQPASRPSSAARPRPAAKFRPASAPVERVISARGRRYRVRQTGDGSQVSLTSLDSLTFASKFSIYTDHGLSEDEEPAPRGAPQVTVEENAIAVETPLDVESEVSSAPSSVPGCMAPVQAADTTKALRSGQVSLGILQVTVAERPLYAELKLGAAEAAEAADAAQCTKSVAGRWPPLAEKLIFEVEDLRAEQTLHVCFWTSVGEWPGPGLRPRCVASGKTALVAAAEQRQVTVTLDVHQNGQLQRGLAVLHMEVIPPKPEFDIFDHSDVHVSRNLLLDRRFKGRRYRGHQDPPFKGPTDRVVDVSSRCWSYLEHRSSALRLRRQQCRERIRKAKALRAGPSTSKGKLKLARVSSEQAFRLQRYLRSVVKGTEHGGHAVLEAKEETLQASDLSDFLEHTLRAPQMSEDDDAALRALLCVDGQVHMQTFLNFMEHGAAVVPPERVVYPDEQRARDILTELFPGFLAKEQQREMELHEH